MVPSFGKSALIFSPTTNVYWCVCMTCNSNGCANQDSYSTKFGAVIHIREECFSSATPPPTLGVSIWGITYVRNGVHKIYHWGQDGRAEYRGRTSDGREPGGVFGQGAASPLLTSHRESGGAL